MLEKTGPDFDFAQRQAEKKVAAKAAAEKKESLLEKAKKLVTGKGAEEKADKAGKPAKAEKPEKAEAAAEGEEKIEKKPPAGKPHGVKGPRTLKGAGKKGGGLHGGKPRKVGS